MTESNKGGKCGKNIPEAERTMLLVSIAIITVLGALPLTRDDDKEKTER